MEEDESNDFDGEQYIQDYLEKDDYIYEEAIHILSRHLIGYWFFHLCTLFTSLGHRRSISTKDEESTTKRGRGTTKTTSERNQSIHRSH